MTFQEGAGPVHSFLADPDGPYRVIAERLSRKPKPAT